MRPSTLGAPAGKPVELSDSKFGLSESACGLAGMQGRPGMPGAPLGNPSELSDSAYGLSDSTSELSDRESGLYDSARGLSDSGGASCTVKPSWISTGRTDPAHQHLSNLTKECLLSDSCLTAEVPGAKRPSNSFCTQNSFSCFH